MQKTLVGVKLHMNQIELGVTQDREDDLVGFKDRMLGRFADLISIGSHIMGLSA